LLLLDNPRRGYLDMGHYDSDVLEFGTIGGPMKYYFIAADGYDDLLTTTANSQVFSP
jgi:hypothetical protein